ncbi:MAG: translation initiation factor [Xanthomonadales bacterium]|nr:translation initiation factor [Xanthomonadales bacterium]
MGKKKRRNEFGSEDLPDENAFAALESLKGSLPSGEESPPETDDQAESGTMFDPKVVISRERSGRGGKTVTVVSGVRLTGQAREDFVRRLRKELGTSGSLEGDRIVLGGDLSRRVEEWLAAAGARRIVIGN